MADDNVLGLAGRPALVIGGGDGIGRESVLLLARAGADVAVADMVREKAEAVQKEAEALGRQGGRPVGRRDRPGPGRADRGRGGRLPRRPRGADQHGGHGRVGRPLRARPTRTGSSTSPATSATTSTWDGRPPADDRRRPGRADGLRGLGERALRRAQPRRLRRGQGRAHVAHALDGPGVGAPRDPGQRGGARHHRHPTRGRRLEGGRAGHAGFGGLRPGAARPASARRPRSPVPWCSWSPTCRAS